MKKAGLRGGPTSDPEAWRKWGDNQEAAKAPLKSWQPIATLLWRVRAKAPESFEEKQGRLGRAQPPQHRGRGIQAAEGREPSLWWGCRAQQGKGHSVETRVPAGRRESYCAYGHSSSLAESEQAVFRH